MHFDTYTPGYQAPILNFMKQRTAESHAAFFLSRLSPGWDVLDAGCGPGTITLGIARKAGPGRVTGIDIEDTQFQPSQEQAVREKLPVEFRKGSVYKLPFADASFDAVFSHALLTHLSAPLDALREMRRVLRPGGVIGIRASDMGGSLIDDESGQGWAAYLDQQRAGSKDPNVGRKLGRLLAQSGFSVERVSASFEVITDALRNAGLAGDPPFVALAWCESIGVAV